MRVVDASKAAKTFAMIGLGTGATACYGRAGDAARRVMKSTMP